MMGRFGGPELLIILAMSLVVIWPAGRICRRLGFSQWLGVLSIVPIVNVLLLWYVAVAQWPVPGPDLSARRPG